MRKSTLRKAVLALGLLVVFMVVLRMSRPAPTDVTNQTASSAVKTPESVATDPKEAQIVKEQKELNDAEAAKAAKDYKEAKNPSKDTTKDTLNDAKDPLGDPKAAKDAIKDTEKGPIRDSAKDTKDTVKEFTIDTKEPDTKEPVQEAKGNAKADPVKESKDSAKEIKDVKDTAKGSIDTAKDTAKDAEKDTTKAGEGLAKDKKDDSAKDKKKESNFDAATLFKRIVESPGSPPVIIFSKSYCPHSRRAKTLLMEGHVIKPAPIVVELDKMDHGKELQNYLGELTGRRTVPNVIVNGVSRGGASDLVELGDKLVPSFLEWGEGRLTIAVQEPEPGDK